MKINSITFRTPTWAIEDLHLDDFNLLVGVSGAGKTQILRALKSIHFLALGLSETRILIFEWKIIFSIDKDKYVWEGEEIIDKKDFKTGRTLKKEILTRENQEIFRREQGETFFLKNPIPKLDTKISLLSHLKEEKEISIIYMNFVNFSIWDNSAFSHGQTTTPYTDLIKNPKKEYRNHLKISDTILNMYIANAVDSNKFILIQNDFKNIFPQVKELKILPISKDTLLVCIVERYEANKQVSEVLIEGDNISSGMLRTLYFLAYLHLSPRDTIMLIDEFENGFAINCIGALAHEMLMQQDKIQFVVTSHHPYIINTIPHENWKIVTRKQKDNINYISVHKSDELDVESSHHEKHMQLINSPLFTEGIG